MFVVAIEYPTPTFYVICPKIKADDFVELENLQIQRRLFVIVVRRKDILFYSRLQTFRKRKSDVAGINKPCIRQCVKCNVIPAACSSSKQRGFPQEIIHRFPMDFL